MIEEEGEVRDFALNEKEAKERDVRRWKDNDILDGHD